MGCMLLLVLVLLPEVEQLPRKQKQQRLQQQHQVSGWEREETHVLSKLSAVRQQLLLSQLSS